MDAVKFTTTSARQVEVTVDAFPDGLYGDLERKIRSLTAQAFGRIQARMPSLTGKLRSELRQRVFTDKNQITGYIDIDAPKGSQELAKAGAEEYGAHKARGLIKAHRMKLDHVWDQRLASPITVMVSAHARPPNIAEVAFERGALAEMQPVIIAELNEAVEKRVAETNR